MRTIIALILLVAVLLAIFVLPTPSQRYWLKSSCRGCLEYMGDCCHALANRLHVPEVRPIPAFSDIPLESPSEADRSHTPTGPAAQQLPNAASSESSDRVLTLEEFLYGT